jgi:heptosyltransferase-2
MNRPVKPLHGIYYTSFLWVAAVLYVIDNLIKCFIPSRKDSLTINSPKSILISNLAGIGDAVLSTSVIPVLKNAFPGVEISFLVGSWSENVFEGHPMVKRVHTIDHFYLNNSKKALLFKVFNYWKTSIKALKEIRSVSYDIAIDLFPHMENSIICLYLSRIPVRIGYISGGFGALLTHRLKWLNKSQHVIYSYMDLLKLLPIAEKDRLIAKVSIPSLGEEELSRVFKQHGVNVENYLVFHIGPSSGWKKWQTEKWRKLAKLLVSDGYQIIFTGNTTLEHLEIATIMAGLSGCVNLCGELSWAGFVSAIKNTRLLISIDTCAHHIASGFLTPCVVLTMGVSPYQWYPIHMQEYTIIENVDCVPCYRRCGCKDMDCLRLISVSRVYKTTKELLSKRP